MYLPKHLAAPLSFGLDSRSLLLLLAILWMGCGPGVLRIETLPQGKELSGYRVESVSGVRDGDKLGARVLLVSGSDRLEMQLRFRIGVPTRLERGRITVGVRGERSWKVLSARNPLRSWEVSLTGPIWEVCSTCGLRTGYRSTECGCQPSKSGGPELLERVRKFGSGVAVVPRPHVPSQRLERIRLRPGDQSYVCK